MSHSKIVRAAKQALKDHGYRCLELIPVKGHYRITVAKGRSRRKIVIGGTPKNEEAAIDNMIKALRRYTWCSK